MKWTIYDRKMVEVKCFVETVMMKKKKTFRMLPYQVHYCSLEAKAIDLELRYDVRE
jgi:hypothetical protein